MERQTRLTATQSNQMSRTTYVLIADVLVNTKYKTASEYTNAWLAMNDDLLAIDQAARALCKVLTYRVNIHPMTKGILGKPIEDVSAFIAERNKQEARAEMNQRISDSLST